MAMQQYMTFLQEKLFHYKLDKYSDDTMFTVYMCLTDGLGMESYVNFLENTERVRLGGNICSIVKLGKMVSLSIHEEIIPDLPVFSTSIDNLIKLYKEIKRLEDLGVNKINISLDNDELLILGE
ncbi:MAG: hypothetical protein AB7F19_05510 [Candidatus Babeliales bacterium]